MKFFWLLQPPRSGGTLFLRLLDNTKEIFVFPVALRFPYRTWPNSMENKKNFNKIFKFINLNKFIEKGIKKQSSNLKQETYKFNFDIKKFNKEIQNKKIKKLKDFILNYFDCFIKNWINYKQKKKKKVIVAHTTLSNPRLFKKNFENFKNCLKKGKIIIILRDPETWFNSAKKLNARSPFKGYSDEQIINYYITFYTTVDQYFDEEKIIIISFNDLILKTKRVIKKILSLLEINFKASMLIPTFNGEKTIPNSSFEINTKNHISNDVIKKTFYGFDKTMKNRVKIAKKIYEKLKKKKI
jgi:hypothetical protein